MARMRHTLQALQAQARAAIALAQAGSAGVVQTLTSLLPPLANSGKVPKVSLTCQHTSENPTFVLLTNSGEWFRRLSSSSCALYV